jgi:hypothetical protein
MGASPFSDGEREQHRREAKRMSSIPELERGVVEAAKACKSEPPPGAWRVLSDAVAALQAAEEAARKPRLRTWRELVEGMGANHTYAHVIAARDAEWVAAMKAILKARLGEDFARAHIEADIEALVAETK